MSARRSRDLAHGLRCVLLHLPLDDGPLGSDVSLDAKLAVFDEHAERAVDELLDWIGRNRGDLVAVARGRHVLGHYLYEDANFLEWDARRIRAEAAEEIADAIVYLSRLIHLTTPTPIRGLNDGDRSKPKPAVRPGA